MFYNQISKAEKKRAIQYLIAKLPAKTVNKVGVLMNKKGRDWDSDHHFWFGLYVRNLLRKGGFVWDFLTLDCIWAELTEEAVRASQKTKIEILPFPPEKKEPKENIWTDNLKIRV